MLSLPLATDQEPSIEPADPVDRFHQQVLVELALAELERQVQQLMRLLPGLEPPTPRRSRRVRRPHVRRTTGGYPAL